MFVSSHVLSAVAKFAEDVVVINHGRLVAHTSIDRLTTGSTVSLRSPDAERLGRALVARGASVTTHEDGTVEVVGISAVDVGELAAAERAVLHQLVEHGAALEDVFLQLTASKESSDAIAA